MVAAILSPILVPLAFGLLALEGALPLPRGMGPRVFVPITLLLYLFSLPLLVLLASRRNTSSFALISAGALPPLPVAFLATLAFGALIDMSEANERLGLLWVVATSGGITGLVVAVVAKWRPMDG